MKPIHSRRYIGTRYFRAFFYKGTGSAISENNNIETTVSFPLVFGSVTVPIIIMELLLLIITALPHIFYGDKRVCIIIKYPDEINGK